MSGEADTFTAVKNLYTSTRLRLNDHSQHWLPHTVCHKVTHEHIWQGHTCVHCLLRPLLLRPRLRTLHWSSVWNNCLCLAHNKFFSCCWSHLECDDQQGRGAKPQLRESLQSHNLTQLMYMRLFVSTNYFVTLAGTIKCNLSTRVNFSHSRQNKY